MEIRTDLALESYESQEKTKIDGVEVVEENGVSIVKVLNQNGAKALGKPVGKYITCTVESFVNDTDIFDGRLEKVSSLLADLLPKNPKSVLVVGIGNTGITADALGPESSKYVLATRHVIDDLQNTMGFEKFVSVASVATGVLGDTGIETAEIVKGIVSSINPSCVIAIDALAASSADRLGTTVQLSDVGIAPGSGVGNHRNEISHQVLGVPVVSVGIPTVVSTKVINENSADEMFVTPREIDRITAQGAKLIGMSINVCLQKGISQRDLFALVG